jgi:hypothetical protein
VERRLALFIHFLPQAGPMGRAEMDPANIFFLLPWKQWLLRKERKASINLRKHS